ncbi:response regulator transcription factor [Priestia aryabhattai]|uniref:response regulator transcription factor n=1 Tax=Priestia aryabhattai TaxID=412384 RepID=UPI002E230B87|nr:response regulator transcription factor [Priestia aryabhattai]
MDVKNKIRIVLADDQAIVRQGLKYIIDSQADMEVIGEAADGETAVVVTKDTIPDVILMDIQMPNGTGIEATQRIVELMPCIKVVLLTTFDVQDYVFDGIRAGAAGYLLKDTDMKELLDGIRWVNQGQAIYRTTMASKALARAISNERAAEQNDTKPLDLPEPLTKREIDVLQQMAYGRRNSEIADILHISQGTVKTHIHRIFQKLSVEDRTQAVVFAIRKGLVK